MGLDGLRDLPRRGGLFFALVMASIALHEIGHLVPGKLFGVKTTQYFVGFGKTLWSNRVGETEYGIKAVPLGGYVRFVGMFPPAKDYPEQVRASPPALPGAGRQRPCRRVAGIRPEDDGRLFYQKKSWQKLDHHGRRADDEPAAGVPDPARRDRHLRRLPVPADGERVQECIVPADAADHDCAGKPATPAALSGIQTGDRMVAFNGHRSRLGRRCPC